MNKYDITSIEEKINECKNINIDQVNINEIDDIENFKINSKKSSVERILDFLVKAKNPYIFKINGKIVKIEFSNNDKTAESCFMNVIKSLYS